MKILVVTEKSIPTENQRDGGFRLVDTLKCVFGNSLSIMQFGLEFFLDSSAKWQYIYPYRIQNRFERRIANAEFIAKQVKQVEHEFTHIIFIHISMQFGLDTYPLDNKVQIWTFPMFLTPSYLASAEIIPEDYLKRERIALAMSKNILTPSHMEKRQLIEYYGIPENRIHVVPRGVKTELLFPKIRCLNGPPIFCSIGSIKPQKNTLGLVQLFKKIQKIYPQAILKIIGPIQDIDYNIKVQDEIYRLGLKDHIKFTGYIPPQKLSSVISETHIHLSTSNCETFGRSIFETLACGLPNIAKLSDNAAAEFLKHLPYAHFHDDENRVMDAIDNMLNNLPLFSSMALEIGELYDEKTLSRLLAARICNEDVIAISDFDGTLYHKNDPERTKQCIKAFKTYPTRILCSARPVIDLLEQLNFYQLQVDWIVGYSGSLVTDGRGKKIWSTPLDSLDIENCEKLIPSAKRIEFENEILQIHTPIDRLPPIFGYRIEVYQGIAFISNWKASKLRAIHRLLSKINWSGKVKVFGDGPYDQELLTYFDGTLVNDSQQIENHQPKENIHGKYLL